MRRVLAAGGCLVAAAALVPAVAGAGQSRTWYVRAGADGTGTAARPFGTLAAVEHASRPGDTIVVLPAPRPLDGGIALKPDQWLRGAGPSVTVLPAGAPAPQVTNTSRDRLDGDAVRLADGATVTNLRIAGAQRGAVYGRDVSAVTVTGNDVSGQNGSCAKGFLIPPFVVPTNVPRLGLPLPTGLQNGWAAIMLDGSRRQAITALIAGNAVHDAQCGDGIDVRAWGTARGSVTVTGNRITRLGQGPAFLSLLAIGVQARDHARLSATVQGNTESELGNRTDLNVGPAGADSEGVFVNGVGPARIDVTVTGNRYTNRGRIGGFSANGLEAVTMGDGTTMRVTVRDSSFARSHGDVIEHGALGTNGLLTMLLDHVVAEGSTGEGDTLALPFNNGDCVLTGSLGAGNDVRLTVRHSVLRNCAGNGLALGSNAVTGRGPTRSVRVEVTDSVITGNRGANIGIRNLAALDDLTVIVRRTDLAGSYGIGSTQGQLTAEDLGTTRNASIDVDGGNCLGAGPALTAEVVGFRVSARDDWWGRAAGPERLRMLVVNGSLDSGRPLPEPPRYCATS